MDKLASPIFMKVNILGDVVGVIALGDKAHMTQAHRLADLIQEFRGCWCRGNDAI